jgi:hypothetical protein
MSYIAVFALFAIPVAKGFSLKEEAAYYLEQANNDPDLHPIGLYDAYKNIVTPYQSERSVLMDTDEILIARLAQEYLKRVV